MYHLDIPAFDLGFCNSALFLAFLDKSEEMAEHLPFLSFAFAFLLTIAFWLYKKPKSLNLIGRIQEAKSHLQDKQKEASPEDDFTSMDIAKEVEILRNQLTELKEEHQKVLSSIEQSAVREEELHDKQRKIFNLMQLFQSVSLMKDEDTVREKVLNCATIELHSEIACLFNVEGDKLSLCSSLGLTKDTQDSFAFSVGMQPFCRVIDQKEILRLTFNPEYSLQNLGLANAPEKLRTLLAVPLEDANSSAPFGILMVANCKNEEYDDDDEDFLRLLASETAIAVSNIHLYAELERSYYEIIQALAQAIEAKDPYTHGHVARVATYAVRLAAASQLPKEDVELIAKAAILHDVGKISVPDNILMKPGSLTQEELKIMQTHVTNGKHMLKEIHSLPDSVIDMITYHHERWDGNGYPDGLKGERIPIGAQVIAIADTFDAMTSDRPYRKGFTFTDALNRMEDASGTQFKPELLNTFLSLFNKGVFIETESADFPKNLTI